MMQVNSRSLVPAAALWQLAAAALDSLLDSSYSGRAAADHVLVQGTLPAPKLLPPTGPCTVLCQLSQGAAGPRLSLTSDSPQAAVHMRSTFGSAARPAFPAPQPFALCWLPGHTLPPSASTLGSMPSQYGTRHHQPAVLDSCLHLGASAPSPAGSMRVPAGFAALSLPASHDVLAWASAGAFSSSSADGSALSSYRLAGGVVRLAVQDLLARPLAPATAAVPASSMASVAQSLQYVLQALVSSPAEHAGSPAWPAAIVWQETSPGQPPRSTQLLRRCSARLLPSQAVRASLMTLARLQTTFSSGPSSRQQLLLRSPLHGSCVEGEAAAAMLRTAAQEQPGISWEVVGNDAHSRYELGLHY